jgi:hypothetical protein
MSGHGGGGASPGSFGFKVPMNLPTNSKELLSSIHRLPGIFWGDSDRPFTSLVAFLSGYSLAFQISGCYDGVAPSELVPLGFCQFVSDRFGGTFPEDGRGWMTFIEQNTKSESEAFELFFQLRGEYEQSQCAKAEQGAPPNRRRACRRKVQASRTGGGR